MIACVVILAVLSPVRPGVENNQTSPDSVVVTPLRVEVECLRVVDGDTIRVMYKGESRAVRLLGIDAPERGKRGAREATAFMKQLVDGREVTLVFPTGKEVRDRYNRLLADVVVDGMDVGKEMLRTGHAVKYR